MDAKIVALAGGSGFIGRAIARRWLAIGGIKVRVLSAQSGEGARAARIFRTSSLFARTSRKPASLRDALDGAAAIVDAIQFDGYPVENPRRGLTFERIDLRRQRSR